MSWQALIVLGVMFAVLATVFAVVWDGGRWGRLPIWGPLALAATLLAAASLVAAAVVAWPA